MTTMTMPNDEIVQVGKGKRVALFATCANDVMFPQTAIAAVKVLERMGCQVAFPREQTCCAQIFTNSGYFKESMGALRAYLRAFEGYDYVVAPSASCTGAVQHQFPMLAKKLGDVKLQNDVDFVAKRTFDLASFLVKELGVTDVGAFFPHKVTYHENCHGRRVTKVGNAPVELLKAVKGLTYIELPDADRCCGFGGTFSMKNPDVSRAMAADKAAAVMSTGAEYVVSGDNLCLMNFGGVLARNNTGIKYINLAEVLAHTQES